MNNKKKIKLQAQIPFERKKARKAMNLDYYKAQGRNIKDYAFIEREKIRLSQKKWDKVTRTLEYYKAKGYGDNLSVTGKILKKIYEKNGAIAKKQIPFKKTEKILPVISRPETLLLAYKRIKGNKGALTLAAQVDSHTLNNFDQKQRSMYYRSNIFPDGISLRDFDLAGFLILKGRYPWGASRRIWLEKPGDKTKKRPITIPPFMDRIVQEAIKMVLESIWEPDFELLNKSFGFRSNKSCHDAIVSINNGTTMGLFRAIEGDIAGAYDNVDKDSLIGQLGKKINDKKFLKFMRNRLNYNYVDGNTRVIPEYGIPQGGIDSPYLFNIYMHDFDLFVQNDLQAYLDNVNEMKQVGDRGLILKPRRNMKHRLNMEIKTLKKIKTELFEIKDVDRIKRNSLYQNISEVRKLRTKLLKMPYIDPNRRRFRLRYVRYADDWVILSNVNYQTAEKLKSKIKDFLWNNLRATLSDQKTLITDIRKEPAHFLGFELRRSKGRQLRFQGNSANIGLRNSGGVPIYFYPDKQRLITRLHAKGFCDKHGFPREVSWLSCLEPQIIIERYNATIAGLMQYYTEWISFPSHMSRWIYILRYSCFKTLAQKYKTTINQILKRFGKYLNISERKTVAFTTTIKVKDESYTKEWTLHSFAEIRDKCLKQKRFDRLTAVFWDREKRGLIGGYDLNPSNPKVTQENYLEAIHWTSLRTQAAFDMPCCICGSDDDVEMHHIRHIRKTPYRELEKITYKQMMALRNRKQIPVCRNCHINQIHKGKYSGPSLERLLGEE